MTKPTTTGIPRPRIVTPAMTTEDIAALRARVTKAKRGGYRLVQVSGDVLLAALKEIEDVRRRWPGAH